MEQPSLLSVKPESEHHKIDKTRNSMVCILHHGETEIWYLSFIEKKGYWVICQVDKPGSLSVKLG